MLENVLRRRRYQNCFGNLGTAVHPPGDILALVEKFTCPLYHPGTGISQVKKLRWHVFRKNQAEWDRFPPTQGALYEAIHRAHYQMIVWNNDKVCCPSLPQPDGFGREKVEDKWISVVTKAAPASNRSSAAVKRTDPQTINPTAGNQAWIAPMFLLWQWWSLWKYMWRYWYTKNWVPGLWQCGVERLGRWNLLEKYDFQFVYVKRY